MRLTGSDAPWRQAGRVLGHALAIVGLGGAIGAVQAGFTGDPVLLTYDGMMEDLRPAAAAPSPTPPHQDAPSDEAAGDSQDAPDGAQPDQAAAAEPPVTSTPAPENTGAASQRSGQPEVDPAVDLFTPRSSVALIDLAAGVFAHANGAVFVDARPAREHERGRIPGSTNLTPDRADDPASLAFRNLISLMPNGDPAGWPVIIYCGGGDCDDSKTVALRLFQRGFANVRVMVDGFDGWTAAGYDVETP